MFATVKFHDLLNRLIHVIKYIYFYNILSIDDLSFPIQGELNLSTLQSPQPSNNRTLQSFVEAYLGKYTGRGLIAFVVFK